MTQQTDGRTLLEYKAQIKWIKGNSKGAKNQGRSGFANCWKFLERDLGISMDFSPLKMHTFHMFNFFSKNSSIVKNILFK